MRAEPSPGAPWIAILLVAILSCTDGVTDPGGRSPERASGAFAPPEGPAESPTGVGRASVRLSPPPGGSFLVRGRYPHVASRCRDPEQPSLTARFPGTLVVRRSPDGTLELTLTLAFERYLEGIAEVPPAWPRAALEAQAIAARSYALATTGWSGEQGETLDEPICATTACQVYRGIPVPHDPVHRRWVRAVRRTGGEVLLHQGRPATTVYFSTSNGQTYGNDEVFGSAALPYLRPVAERDDGASSTSRWRTLLPFDDLTRFLREAGIWPRGRAISVARPRGDSLTLRGGVTSRSVALGDLRDAVNQWAPCLEPGRYPDALPLTIPSRWMDVSAARGGLVVTGRGWGHGVGMVQWGAYGKARRGFSAADILAYYYGGLRPQRHPEPGLIHVQVASGLRTLRIVSSSPGARLGARLLDGRRFVVVGGDRLEIRR
jgi:SpoIID/LytB domain protein